MTRWFSASRLRSWFDRQRRFRALLNNLNGKSVVIVGNAASLLSHRHGELIDGHDLVIRMNRGFPIDVAAQGQRCDIWCFSTIRMVAEVPSVNIPKHAVWMSPKLRKAGGDAIAACFYPRRYWHALRAKLGARPSVGAMTIDLVSRSAARQVTIIGFDFKKSRTFYNDAGAVGAHDYAGEARFVTALVEERCWRFVST